MPRRQIRNAAIEEGEREGESPGECVVCPYCEMCGELDLVHEHGASGDALARILGRTVD